MTMDLKPYLAKVAGGEALSREESAGAFRVMMSGEATPTQIGGFLMALRVRGESVDEIAGAVDVMRASMVRVEAPTDAIDIVGTGGDHAGTLNISTCAALVVAGCGVVVAKHGNRALSSRSGAADVLAALGVDVELKPSEIGAVIAKAGIGFMFAPSHHSAMRFVGPSRVELGTRTVFNILGPLSNPAGVTRILVGVFSAQWVMPIAETLRALGTRKAWVVHGDGLDEMTVCGPTEVAALDGETITSFTIRPQEFGLPCRELSEIKGGDGAANAIALKAVLDGEKSAYRDIVLLNAAGALVVADRVPDLKAGLELAASAIDTGAARAALVRLVEASQMNRSIRP